MVSQQSDIWMLGSEKNTIIRAVLEALGVRLNVSCDDAYIPDGASVIVMPSPSSAKSVLQLQSSGERRDLLYVVVSLSDDETAIMEALDGGCVPPRIAVAELELNSFYAISAARRGVLIASIMRPDASCKSSRDVLEYATEANDRPLIVGRFLDGGIDVLSSGRIDDCRGTDEC